MCSGFTPCGIFALGLKSFSKGMTGTQAADSILSLTYIDSHRVLGCVQLLCLRKMVPASKSRPDKPF
jgi:hypothetical protein